jgi:hypothetical protein
VWSICLQPIFVKEPEKNKGKGYREARDLPGGVERLAIAATRRAV